MIDANELLLRIKMSLEFNQEFYPNSAFTMDRTAVKEQRSSQSLVSSDSKIARILDQAMTLINSQRKVQLIQIVVQKILKRLEITKSSDTKMNAILAKAIAAMPTAHRLVARKDYNTLKTALPIIKAVSTEKISVETYDPENVGSDDLYSKLDILDQNILHIAALNNDYRGFSMLVKSGTVAAEDCLAEDIQGLTPLHIILLNTQNSSQKKSYEALTMLKLLIKMGWIRIDDPCLGNQSLLHFAAQTNNVLLCQLLLTLNADVNIVNKLDGNTPLHYTCQANNLEALGVLLDNNANPLIMNKKDLTPAQVAVNSGFKHILPLLRQNTMTATETCTASGSPPRRSMSFDLCRDNDDDTYEPRTEPLTQRYQSTQDKAFFPRTPTKEELGKTHVPKGLWFSSKAKERPAKSQDGCKAIMRTQSESSLLGKTQQVSEPKLMTKARSAMTSFRTIRRKILPEGASHCRK